MGDNRLILKSDTDAKNNIVALFIVTQQLLYLDAAFNGIETQWRFNVDTIRLYTRNLILVAAMERNHREKVADIEIASAKHSISNVRFIFNTK